MSTSIEQLHIANLDIDVIRKDIKNMHLAVYPPTGRIRLAAPSRTDDEVIRLFAISKLAWIKRHIKNFKSQARETPRDFVSGESHYFQGRRYLINVIEHDGRNKVEIKNHKEINLFVKNGASKSEKAKVFKEWYRKELKAQIPEIIEKWEKVMDVKAQAWGVKHMRTKWGTCNTIEKRIWINLELAKKPKNCLEYIIVHELVHLLERSHNDRFIALMNKFMPKWRAHRDELNKLPVSHTDWGY
ncbi:metal-dependent hydrolase [Roseivirga seohaensis]|uniref:Metal-dependent hydrolase n=1 Tax=Roseivirga seohaensis TaxID=1914963 RepID=A0A150XKW7_9BACT|nr:SprT family zinc-dependent metalloprotease [Roseivirga seohaensis]KYG79374.1 metal-dependent hydrolase [Roseivirga seohaensis]